MNVLIVEDDPMVEFIHRNYLEKIAKFQQIFSSDTVAEAEKLLAAKSVDLVLLDIHLKDGNGLAFLSWLRKNQQTVEVIIITAANETRSVQEGLHLGVLDYLVKPFTYERFAHSITLFFNRQAALDNKIMAQHAIDQLFSNKKPPLKQTEASLAKGLTPETLAKIKTTIQTFDDFFTIQALAEASKLSHVSVRKYLFFLEEHNDLISKIVYTKVGRPYKVFRKV